MTYRQPTHQEIAARAYQIFLERGREAGRDKDDWLQAEYELMQLPVRKLAELAPPQSDGKDTRKRRTIVDLVRATMY